MHGHGLHEPRLCPFIHFSGLGPPPSPHGTNLIFLISTYSSSSPSSPVPVLGVLGSEGLVIPILPVCCGGVCSVHVQSSFIGYWSVV